MKITSGKSYQSRAWFMKKLGFSSYREYLESALWAEIRKRVFEVKGRRCWLCGRPATQAHHTRYHEADLTGRKLKHIHPICGPCHKEVEFMDGEKQTVAGAKKAFKRKRREHMPVAKELLERDKLVKLLCEFGEPARKRMGWASSGREASDQIRKGEY